MIQDFDFPISCNQLEMTPDEQYIIATGVYAPQIKIFEISELSQKCLRGVDSEVVKFVVLGEDYTKLAFACVDRNIEFHAQYGKHFKVRVPKHPRDMVYNPHSCDLLVGGYSNEIYRFSLDDGSFLTPFASLSKEINALHYNPYLNLVMTGGLEGITEIWDYRIRKQVTSQVLNNGSDITKIAVDSGGLLYGVGSANGLVRLYDVRHEKPVLEIQHHYKMPINQIQFHEKSRNILSSSKKILKINNRDTGKIFTNIEPKSHINMFELCKNSGLILVAADCPRMGIYFVPQLDNAPKWCSFLENITEELEEELNNVVYDEFKFVTLEEIEELGCANLIGTKMLKSYLHGYLMHIKLYHQLTAKQDTFKYLKYQQEQIKEKMEEKVKSRIQLKKQEIKYNREYFEELQKQKAKSKTKKANIETIVTDDRFGSLFSNKNFQIDRESEAYKLAHPSERAQHKLRQAEEDEDYGSEAEEGAEEGADEETEGGQEEEEQPKPQKLYKSTKKITKGLGTRGKRQSGAK